MEGKEPKSTMSRRRFIRNSGLVAGGLVGGGVIGGLIGANTRTGEQAVNPETGGAQTGKVINFQQAPLYFSNMERFAVLEAACERIFPEDQNGPGAISLGVPFFIDHQLAGAWGYNAKEYMQGPFYPGSEFQGYQTALLRHEVFDEGITAIETYSHTHYDGAKFVDLDDEQKDDVLSQFADGEVEMHGVTSTTFFRLLRAATLEGVYADPAYGGNKNMQGWRMKGFPGHQMSFLNQIESEEFIEIEPNSLRNYTDHH
ncbi:gluconate 2-dehydrogenase subunit 3 family protein [Alkalihalobacillus sp. 1P02AB]|uniref:gluconate 2-dehydrogenase subunit 3 family protein n=1 Tax=Alkalihalobacillus sp. 1P02AB TaxID=3132260 RepID=UPI0039A42582